VATTKVCGIETEYGIHSPGAEQNPISASSVLVNAYASDIEQKIGWDFEDETPGNDARGFAREGSLAPMVETHLANTVLTNGPNASPLSSAWCTTRRGRRCCAGP
jgi:hypothetical protein